MYNVIEYLPCSPSIVVAGPLPRAAAERYASEATSRSWGIPVEDCPRYTIVPIEEENECG
jgi:hypothetical protein